MGRFLKQENKFKIILNDYFIYYIIVGRMVGGGQLTQIQID